MAYEDTYEHNVVFHSDDNIHTLNAIKLQKEIGNVAILAVVDTGEKSVYTLTISESIISD